MGRHEGGGKEDDHTNPPFCMKNKEKSHPILKGTKVRFREIHESGEVILLSGTEIVGRPDKKGPCLGEGCNLRKKGRKVWVNSGFGNLVLSL